MSQRTLQLEEEALRENTQPYYDSDEDMPSPFKRLRSTAREIINNNNNNNARAPDSTDRK